MLNPGATEFKPAFIKPSQTDTPSKSSNKSSSSTRTNKTRQQHDDKTSSGSNKSRQQKPASSTTPTNATKIPDSTSKDGSIGHVGKSTTIANASSASHTLGDHSKASGKKQSSKQRASTTLPQQKKPSRQTQPQQHQRPTSHTASDRGSVFLVEQQPPTSFITIDQPIDPVHVIPGAQALKNTIIHNYDRYIVWIERCLQTHAVVTLVGMDPAISDVLSLATIIQAKGIGSYHELATFSMDEPGGGRQHQHPISGVQLKLHRN